jgi:hypothetical protein
MSTPEGRDKGDPGDKSPQNKWDSVFDGARQEPQPPTAAEASGPPADVVADDVPAAADPPPPVADGGADDELASPRPGPRSERRRRRSKTPFLIAGVLLLVLAAAIVALVLRDDDSSAPVAAGATTTTAAATETTEAPPARGCPGGNWPGLTIGEPTALAAGQTGYYVWNDFTGWHVRFIDTGGDPQRFNGTVTGSDRMQAVTKVPADSEGTVELKANQVTFDLAGDATARGFDVAVGCPSNSLRFDLQGSGLPWPVDGISLGREGRAVANPLTIQRVQR